MIEIDDEVYGFDDIGSFETVFMTGAFEDAVGVLVLERAAARFMLTGEDGIEYDDVDVPADQGIYTPNYTSDPKVTEFGIELYVDCKGGIAPPMRTTFRRILCEEARRAGIHEARIVAAKGSYDGSRMVPLDRDERKEAAELAAWKEAAFALSIELGPDGSTVDFRIVQQVEWDGSDRLVRHLYDLVRRHGFTAQDPSRWPSHLEDARDLPWRVVLECSSAPDAAIRALIANQTSRHPRLSGPGITSTGAFVVRPEEWGGSL